MEIFQRLCDSYRAHAVPRARLVSGLAKLLRRLTTSTTAPATPLLDLSRRLAASKLLGGSEPGALEALELLLNAILNHSEAPEAPTAVMLAGQFLANCFHQPLVGEALLPVAAEALQLPTWRAVWDPSGHAKAREAVAVLLLNASVALRKARFRASHGPLLEQDGAAPKFVWPVLAAFFLKCSMFLCSFLGLFLNDRAMLFSSQGLGCLEMPPHRRARELGRGELVGDGRRPRRGATCTGEPGAVARVGGRRR